MEKKKRTAEWGANKERTAILAKVRRMNEGCGGVRELEELESWLLQRNERYNKRKGGLQRGQSNCITR